MYKFAIIDWIACVIVIIGGLNWGMVGLFQVDLVAFIFGDMTTLTRIIYTVVGLSSLWTIYLILRVTGIRLLPISQK